MAEPRVFEESSAAKTSEFSYDRMRYDYCIVIKVDQIPDKHT